MTIQQMSQPDVEKRGFFDPHVGGGTGYPNRWLYEEKFVMHKLTFWIIVIVISFGMAFQFGISGNLAPLVAMQAVAESQKFNHEKKLSLIRQLIKIRVQNDQLLKNKYEGKNVPKVDDFPEIVLMGLPEGTIVSIVETFWMMKSQTNASDKEILDAIERHRKTLFPESGQMPSSLTLSNYIKYRLNIEHSQGVPISNEFIDECIRKANEAYR